MASHNGSTMVGVLEAVRKGNLEADPKVVISNNRDANALKRAQEYSIASYHLSSKTHPDLNILDTEICSVFKRHNVTLIVLSGYMKKVGPITLQAFRNRILNIHPGLLPKYGGRGMYGDNVHKAVLENHEKNTGITVHLVNEEYDQGLILAQKVLRVHDSDTVEGLQNRVKTKEPALMIEVLKKIKSGEVRLPAS